MANAFGIKCPDGYNWYMRPVKGHECIRFMEDFEAGYCCRSMVGPGPFQNELEMDCPDGYNWYMRPVKGHECIRSMEDFEAGYCCHASNVEEDNQDDRVVQAASALGQRARLRALPSGDSLSKMLVKPGVHLRANFFGEDVWRVYRDVDEAGDCFFDCVSRAINSAGIPGMSVARLRWQITRGVNDFNIMARRTDYMLNAPNDELQAVYASMDALTLREYMMTPDHYATLADILTVYSDAALDITPIVINSNYGNKSLQRWGQGFMTNGCVMSYAAPAALYRRRRFVLLYKRNEHFQLMIRLDREMPPEHVSQFRERPKYAFRAIFEADEIPPVILQAFESLLDYA